MDELRRDPSGGSVDRADLRARLARFGPREKKVVGGMLAVLFKHPERARDREWVSEQFVHVALLAGGLEDVEAVQAYAREHVDEVLSACFLAFRATAEDLAPRAATGFSLEEALYQALTYFAPAPDDPPA